MKESYNEGVASRIDPESCLDDPVRAWGSVDRGSTGGLLSSEITLFREPTTWTGWEGNTGCRVKTQAAVSLGGVRELGMCGHSLHGKKVSKRQKGVKKGVKKRKKVKKGVSVQIRALMRLTAEREFVELCAWEERPEWSMPERCIT